MMSEPSVRPLMLQRLKLREPFSGLSHLGGAILGIAALVVLVSVARGDPWHVSGFVIYGASLIVLYMASALYHLLPVGARHIARLRLFDHIGIYLLIAGTYTPICLVPLRGGWGWSLFGVVWGLALFGIIAEIVWRSAPYWLSLVLYLIMGWLVLIALGPVPRILRSTGPDSGPASSAPTICGTCSFSAAAPAISCSCSASSPLSRKCGRRDEAGMSKRLRWVVLLCAATRL